jgi:uncharacterized protein
LKITRVPRSFALLLLRCYKYAISPMFPPSCRYTPTCSEYAAEAIERYGIVRGSAMAAWRLLRCHPFVRGGYDPVPGNFHVAAALQSRPGQDVPDRIYSRSFASVAGSGDPALHN